MALTPAIASRQVPTAHSRFSASSARTAVMVSVLPANRLPSRPIQLHRLQQHFDERAEIHCGLGPPPDLVEASCLQRAWKRFQTRVVRLKDLFGQMLPAGIKTAEHLWKQVRQQFHLAVTEDPSQTNRIVRVPADQVLAIVNGVALTLNDLVPLGTNETRRVMTEEFYQHRLDRAIDRELTFQVASAHKVDLTATQQRILDQARAQLRKRQETSDIIWTSVTPEAIEFESREHTARLLQVNLLQATGLQTGEPPPSPYATLELVERYYQAHLDRYGPLPEEPDARQAAWQKISTQIHQDIHLSVQKEYELKRREYLDQQRASATITINPPSS